MIHLIEYNQLIAGLIIASATMAGLALYALYKGTK